MKFTPEIIITVIRRRIKVALNLLALFDDGIAGELIIKRLSCSSGKEVELMEVGLGQVGNT